MQKLPKTKPYPEVTVAEFLRRHTEAIREEQEEQKRHPRPLSPAMEQAYILAAQNSWNDPFRRALRVFGIK